jgi:hypothetical protein
MSDRDGPPPNVIHSVQSAFVVVHGAADAAAAIKRLDISAAADNGRFMRQTIPRGQPQPDRNPPPPTLCLTSFVWIATLS